MSFDFTPPDAYGFFQVLLRAAHVLFGIAWIGMLYFFNLVNVPVMAKLDAPTKGKVIPVLMPRALWLFRWSALWTGVVGLVYYALLARAVGHAYLGIWLVVTLAFYALVFFLLSPKAKLQKDGRVLAAIVTVVSIVFFFVVHALEQKFRPDGLNADSHVIYIGIGGGWGIWMLLNVWGIIWRNQKRIIEWTRANAENGTPMPAEAPVLARQAFLASRTNAWLSIPMLLLMIMAGHGSVLFG